MSRTDTEAHSSRSGLSYFAAAFPLLCALSLGFVPALKGSSVGLDPFIGYSDLFADAMSQLGTIGTLLLGTTSLVPFIQRRSHLFEAGLFMIAALYAYLILMAASRVILPDAWIAIASAGLAVSFFPLLRVRNPNALFLAPAALHFLGSGLGSLELSHFPEITRELLFALGEMLDIVAMVLAFVALFVGLSEEKLKRSAFLFALVLIAIPLGARFAIGPQTTGFLGYLERAFAEFADRSIVTPGYAGALLLPTSILGVTGIVTGRVRNLGIAAAILLTLLAPAPLTIAAFATLTLRIYVEGAEGSERPESLLAQMS